MKRAWLLIAMVALVVGAMALPATAQSYVDGLIIEKSVLGDAPDGAEFEFEVVCTFEGATTVDTDFTLTDGGLENISDLDPGSVCTITERAPAGADFDDADFVTAYLVSPESTRTGGDSDSRTVEVTLPLDVEDFGPSISIEAVNDFGDTFVLGSGELIVSKRVSGDADGEWDFEVTCPGSVQETVTLGDGDSASFNVVRGVDTTCTVTELAPDGFSPSFRIDDGDEVSGAEASFAFDDEDVPVDVDLIREVDFFNTPDEDDEDDGEEPVDETAVLSDTGFELSWGLLLAAGLLLPGVGAVVYARKREGGRS